MIELPRKLAEIKSWYDFNKDTISDPMQRREFQRRCFEQFLALFATAVNDLREINGVVSETERPYWQPLEIPTFIKKEANAEDE